MTHGNYIPPPGVDWFTNLEKLLICVLDHNPSLVLIGAGSYGLPLSDQLLSNGISSIVCGGSLQLLFGLLGKRWLNLPDYKCIFNNYWKYPSVAERPPGFSSIEGGCYW